MIGRARSGRALQATVKNPKVNKEAWRNFNRRETCFYLHLRKLFLERQETKEVRNEAVAVIRVRGDIQTGWCTVELKK